MPKIRVEWRATVMVDVSVTAKQLRQLEAGEIELDDVVDETVPYRALSSEGDCEFVDWDPIEPKRRTPKASTP